MENYKIPTPLSSSVFTGQALRRINPFCLQKNNFCTPEKSGAMQSGQKSPVFVLIITPFSLFDNQQMNFL